MPTVNSISCRKVLNSHVQFTSEFVVQLADGAVGIGASPKGETISIYENHRVAIDPQAIIEAVAADGYLGRPLEQADFDTYLQQRTSLFGQNNTFGLSLAFFNAAGGFCASPDAFETQPAKPQPPHLCCNILNGGRFAYTNPVLSDFAEFMLVARNNNIEDTVVRHNDVQNFVKDRLLRQPKSLVCGNVVSCFGAADNRAPIELLLDALEMLGLTKDFDLMIDASAGDLWNGDHYEFAITDGTPRSSEDLCQYWLDMIREYDLRFLEDPFHERDFESWRCLTASQGSCYVIGDNLYSSAVSRIEEGVAKKYTHGVVLKPNQAGTVSAIRRAIEVTQQAGQIPITSHRSISTESTFLSALTCKYGVKYIKIGPLLSDYSSVLRLNEIIRLTGVRAC